MVGTYIGQASRMRVNMTSTRRTIGKLHWTKSARKRMGRHMCSLVFAQGIQQTVGLVTFITGIGMALRIYGTAPKRYILMNMAGMGAMRERISGGGWGKGRTGQTGRRWNRMGNNSHSLCLGLGHSLCLGLGLSIGNGNGCEHIESHE